MCALCGPATCLEKKLEHDLSRDDFDSAAVLLEELGERRPDLTEQVADLRFRMHNRPRELDDLRSFQADRNLDIGRRTRAFMMLVFAFSNGIIPPLASSAASASRSSAPSSGSGPAIASPRPRSTAS